MSYLVDLVCARCRKHLGKTEVEYGLEVQQICDECINPLLGEVSQRNLQWVLMQADAREGVVMYEPWIDLDAPMPDKRFNGSSS
jgi:hypothetical protein